MKVSEAWARENLEGEGLVPEVRPFTRARLILLPVYEDAAKVVTLIFAAVALAISTSELAVSSYQSDTATRALDESTESFRIGQRAWSHIQRPSPTKPTEPSPGFPEPVDLPSLFDDKCPVQCEYRFIYWNIGNTAARNVEVKARCRSESEGLEASIENYQNNCLTDNMKDSNGNTKG